MAKLVVALLLAACGIDHSSPPADAPPVVERDPLCARHAVDFVTDRYCVNPPPQIHGLADLYRLFGVQTPSISITAHSTSLVTRSVNALNPRVIVAQDALETGVALAFTRGGQLVELVDRDPDTHELAFFLVSFEQACSATGCTNAELYSEAVESGWTHVRIDQDVDLRNTPLDCLQCHQPDGPGSHKILRMQELRFPWTHFMRPDDELTAAFLDSHGDEQFAALPSSSLVSLSNGLRLQAVIESDFNEQVNGEVHQPNEFPTRAIESEVAASPDGDSPTWRAIYANARAGVAIPVPYRRTNVADPEKLHVAAAAYRAYRQGTAVDDTALNLAAVMREDAERDTGIRPEAGADGRTILVQMCQRCHNARLDQTITRARFNTEALDAMPAAEKELAVERLRLPSNASEKMPPPRFGELTPDEIDRAIEVLRR